jgi:hypothetical protein
MLEAGNWSLRANELVIAVAESQAVVDMSFGTDARRLAIGAASGILGRGVGVKVVPGASLVAAAKGLSARERTK